MQYMWESLVEIAYLRISPLLKNGISISATFKEWRVALYNVDTDFKSFQRNSAWLPHYLKHGLHHLILKACLASVLYNYTLQQQNQLCELTNMYLDILCNSHSSSIRTCLKGRRNGYFVLRREASRHFFLHYTHTHKLESTWNLLNVCRRPAST